MECFQTCVDQGNRCFFSKEKLTCIDCGRYRKGYSVPITRCSNCHQTHSCKCPEVRCECAEVSCLEWFLSLFGLGQKKSTKDNCTSTAAKAGDTTAQASETEPLEISICRSKEGFAVTLQRIGSVHKCERSSKTSIPPEQSREPDKKFKLDDSYPQHKSTALSAAGAAAGDEDKKRSTEEKGRKKKSKDKSPKWTSSNSSTESRGRSRRRKKSKSRSRSGSATKGKEGAHGVRAVSVSSSGSRTGKGRSRSCSSSICSCSPIFKPYRHKYSFLKCSSYTPLTAPVHACTSPSTAEPTLGQKYSRAPSKPCTASLPFRTLQSSDCSPPQSNPCDNNKEQAKNKKGGAVQSASMSCGGEAKRCCTRGTCKPTNYPIYNPPCPYFCKLPCRSQSFHTTMVSGPSPRAVCIPNHISYCPCDSSCGRSRCLMPKLSGNRKSRSCPRSCPCPIKSSCCSPPPCFKGCGPKPCACLNGGKKCLCCCVSGCKAIPCPPTCTKPCCLPCPRQFQVIPYCQRPSVTNRVYSSLSKCIKSSPCPCPPGACLCAKSGQSPTRICCNQLVNMAKPVCCSGFTASYIKSKQGDAVCQQLLNKYGYSSVSSRCSQPICTGMTFCPNPCNTNLCKKMSKPSCMCNLQLGPETKSCCGARAAGCRSCRPCLTHHEHPSACEPAENYTNSRKPTSPSDKRRQIIQFNSEPCEKPPRREFYLAPHCLRKTGPRSPVREYMYKMSLPKKKPKDKSADDADQPTEAAEVPTSLSPEIPKVDETKDDKEVKDEEAKVEGESGAADKEDEQATKTEGEEAAEGKKEVPKKKKRRKSKSSKGKITSDENASAVNGAHCSVEMVEHDVMLFVCDLCPSASVMERLDGDHLELCKNNNHGCEQCVPRHAHFSQAKFYPGFRFESSTYDPNCKNYPFNMTAFATSKQLRPTYDIYRLGTYVGPSFGFSTTCYNRPNDKRSVFDEKLFCTSRLSKNWNVNAINTTKYRTATYNKNRTSSPTVYRSFPKSIIYNKLESEIQRKIQQIKINDCKTKTSTWRKNQLEMPPVVPMVTENVIDKPNGGEEHIPDHDPVTEEFINSTWKALKQRQSIRQSMHQSVRPSMRHSAHPSVRPSLQQNGKEEESVAPPEEAAPPEEEPKATDAEKKESCSSFACVACDNNNDGKQSNCNHDASSTSCHSNISMPSENGDFRKDILSPDKSAVPAAVPLMANSQLLYGKESSVDGAAYELAQRTSPEEKSGDKNHTFEDESGNACIKNQQETAVRTSCSTIAAVPEEMVESFFNRFDESVNVLIQTELNTVGDSGRLSNDLTKPCQERERCQSGIVEDCHGKGAAIRTSAPSCSVVSSLSSVTVTSSTTISIASVSNIESMHCTDPHRLSVVQRISSIRKHTRSKFGVDSVESQARTSDTPIKYLVRNAFVPRDGSDVFHSNEARLRSPCTNNGIGSRANSRIHSDVESLMGRSVSRASNACDNRCREIVVSGSSVDPVETIGNESQNHPSTSLEDLCQTQAETDQLLSSSRAHVTELLDMDTQMVSSAISVSREPDIPKAAEPLVNTYVPVNDVSVDIIRQFGTPV